MCSELPTTRHHRGKRSYHAGLAAEEVVARAYRKAGLQILARRWRGTAGEIDLIAQDGDALVFVEVKHSGSFDRALARVTPRQVARLFATAEEYLGTQPCGSLTDVRFDLAVVDGQGFHKVIENAFM
jgi:putative endonuclease